jgi:mono/diheme cytochrome c family protein
MARTNVPWKPVSCVGASHRGRFAPVRVCVGILVAIATATASGAAAEQPPALPRLELVDLDGRAWRLAGGGEGDTATAVVFLSTTCPIATASLPRLDEIAERPAAADAVGHADDARATTVRCFGVVSDPMLTRAAAVAHFAARRNRLPILFDASGELRAALRPTHVPEAFLFDGSGALVYRGAIDDAFAAVGRRRTALRHHYLQDAIAAVSRGVPPPVAFVAPVGCVLESPAPRAAAAVTYARDIAPIVQARCQTCHRPGEAAPFSLTTAAEAAAVAPMIVEVTRQRIMPPWPPRVDARHPLVGERWLSDAEIARLAAWAEAGCPPGDPADLPPSPQFATGWQLGQPDLVVRMPESFTVPAEGPDVFRNFVIPLDLPEDKVVSAIEFHPGDRRVVHHAVLFLDESGTARRLDAADAAPGYEGFGGPGFLPSGALGGWSVGNTPRRLPGGRGRYLRRGSDLVVQVHYHPDGVERGDRSEIGLFFVPEPTATIVADRQRLVGSIWLANYTLDIPAGVAAYPATARYRLPRGVTVVGVVPHMHLLGRSIRVQAVLPDGGCRPLIDIPSWNYAWQDEYLFEHPFALPAGTELVVDAVFDNSAGNPSNPSSPPRRVTWGDGTLDEMLFCFLLMSADTSEDLVHVVLDNLGHDLRQPRGAP